MVILRQDCFVELCAKVVTREQFPELHELVERIVARNDLPKPKIAVINSAVPNAFATGKSQRKPE